MPRLWSLPCTRPLRLPTNQLTTTYRWFLAGWAKRLSWREVATVFRTSWQSVFRLVRHAVHWGIAHVAWSDVETIGVDEIQWQRGQSTHNRTSAGGLK